MRAKTAKGKLSTRKFAPPPTTDLDENRQQWNQNNSEARALAARERAEARRELQEQELAH